MTLYFIQPELRSQSRRSVTGSNKSAAKPWLQSPLNTDSFEVSVNGQLIYSKLNTGTFPETDEMTEKVREMVNEGKPAKSSKNQKRTRRKVSPARPTLAAANSAVFIDKSWLTSLALWLCRSEKETGTLSKCQQVRVEKWILFRKVQVKLFKLIISEQVFSSCIFSTVFCESAYLQFQCLCLVVTQSAVITHVSSYGLCQSPAVSGPQSQILSLPRVQPMVHVLLLQQLFCQHPSKGENGDNPPPVQMSVSHQLLHHPPETRAGVQPALPNEGLNKGVEASLVLRLHVLSHDSHGSG
ncbi:hypothetical protein INR49_020226 [Caranx melampygus]|nr:hypothetical protein INR49_020226 [Caranx melampygus]